MTGRGIDAGAGPESRRSCIGQTAHLDLVYCEAGDAVHHLLIEILELQCGHGIAIVPADCRIAVVLLTRGIYPEPATVVMLQTMSRQILQVNAREVLSAADKSLTARPNCSS